MLVTHLHSYATPFVRYDVGDFADVSEVCECGHDGPVLKNIYGRKKRLLKHTDGSVTPFSVVARNILQIVKCDEYRIRQTELDTIDVKIRRRGPIKRRSNRFVDKLVQGPRRRRFPNSDQCSSKHQLGVTIRRGSVSVVK